MSGRNRDRTNSRDGRGGLTSRSPQPPARTDCGDTDSRSRAQTTLDFAIGISVFLAVMLFVFAFVPGILEPFNLSGEQDTVLSERLASKLSQGTLGNASYPYVLESHCTVQFFDEGSSPPSHCQYEGDTLNERLALEEWRNVNVSIEGTFDVSDGSDLLCWQDNGNEQILVEHDAGSCDQLLVAGGDPPTANDATVTSRRVVSLHQHNVTLKVVVW